LLKRRALFGSPKGKFPDCSGCLAIGDRYEQLVARKNARSRAPLRGDVHFPVGFSFVDEFNASATAKDNQLIGVEVEIVSIAAGTC
jgi:hypothetical protein